jgi:hypothetical protein
MSDTNPATCVPPAPRLDPVAPVLSVGGVSWQLLTQHGADDVSESSIAIFENPADGARLYVERGAVQSHALPGGESLFPYVRAARDLLLRAGARRIAILGGAGGTLATMLARSGARCVLVDINPAAFSVAREYFWLPPTVECVVADARAYLEERRGDGAVFDAIVVDAYDRDGRLPEHLADEGFFRLARRNLGAAGLVLVNVFAEAWDDPVAGRLAGNIAAAGLPASILEDEGPPPGDGESGRALERNMLVVGGRFLEGWLPLPADAPGFWDFEERFRSCRAAGWANDP